MKEIINFEINGKKYTIYDVDKIEGKSSYIGETRYKEGIILIEYSDIPTMLDTLRHELAHVWLYENGHKNQNGDEVFNYEDVCEYVALSNNSINRIVKKYLKAKGL